MANSIKQLEKILSKAAPEEQRMFLRKLPGILKISWSDLTLLKASQKSFDFWNNKEDAAYDKL
jgi:ATP-dependent DNA ligase